MSAFQQHRHFHLSFSSTWVLLLLSLYFSWICPAESPVAPLPGLGLVTTQRVAIVAVCAFSNFFKTKEPHAAAFFPRVHVTLAASSLKSQKLREALLPASTVVVQLEVHRPRSAFALS